MALNSTGGNGFPVITQALTAVYGLKNTFMISYPEVCPDFRAKFLQEIVAWQRP
jgi:hypothetical protein